MKQTLLLALLILSATSYAQVNPRFNDGDTIPYRSLIISEFYGGDNTNESHIELTNMGSQPVQLNQFKFGNMYGGGAVLDVWNDPWSCGSTRWFWLPTHILMPGESYVIAPAWDYGPRKYKQGIPGFEGLERPGNPGYLDVADFLIHRSEGSGAQWEPADSTDQVTVWIDSVYFYYSWGTLKFWNHAIYIEQHFANGDSAVIDQVGGVFDNNGTNFGSGEYRYEVAGVANGLWNSFLMRKYSIKNGNLDFANARGLGLDDSEWIPVTKPPGHDAWRDLWWTVGNHVSAKLDATTLEPVTSGFEIDFASKRITIPWGTLRLDDIMRNMKKKPGLAWNYYLNENRVDSLYRSARTGDKMTVYASGTELQLATFDIIVREPAPGANIVIPIDHKNDLGPVTNRTQKGILEWPRVTRYDSGMDTITGSWHGLPHSTRIDTLFKYLEKPPQASWEIVFLNDEKRPDLKSGDKLKVTAQNGNVKEYYIQVQSFQGSSNAELSAITWPDIPDLYKGIFGWKGDTVPSFSSGNFEYRVQVPLDVEGIPALVAKTKDVNTTVEVKRAVSLVGTREDRITTFTATSENNRAERVYNVELIKEKDPSSVQPYHAEPFLSEYDIHFRNNWFLEIFNPGNQPLDLSNYMFVQMVANDHAHAITQGMGIDYTSWARRYRKYVPGYRWVDESEWTVNPGILKLDISVDPIVLGNDVFCMGMISDDSYYAGQAGYDWPVPAELDVQFFNYEGIHTYSNPWGEYVDKTYNVVAAPAGHNFYIFKILNDSIKRGLKPANDPMDFELIEQWASSTGNGKRYRGGGLSSIRSYRRKPHINLPNKELDGISGVDEETSEFWFLDRNKLGNEGYGWPWRELYVLHNFGQHFFEQPTHYMSTVSSVIYKVSEGYSMNEKIRGMKPGVTIAEFFGNLIKADSAQSLSVKSAADGSNLKFDALIGNNDILVVLSADSSNTTQYVLEVTEQGLSSDAVLTSNLYNIFIENQTESLGEGVEAGFGYISGFEYGTRLRTVMNNLKIPNGATLDIIDSKGTYVPMKILNFDTTYIFVTVNSGIHLDVLAEDGVTRIVYQLQPNVSDNDAFILSDVYTVDQQQFLVHLVPRETNIQTFLSNIVPSFGSSVKMIDKMGNEKTEGRIVEDDKVVVISANGLSTKVYYISYLSTLKFPVTTYLAYVLSDNYAVNQVDYKISGGFTQFSKSTLLTDFYNNIHPCIGSTAIVVDANGVEKDSEYFDDGDKLKVTSADGRIVVWYDLDFHVTSADMIYSNSIKIYPNPTVGKLNVSGIEPGHRIQIYAATGALIKEVKAQGNLEILSLEDIPSGMFLIIISNNNRMLGRYKAIKLHSN